MWDTRGVEGLGSRVAVMRGREQQWRCDVGCIMYCQWIAGMMQAPETGLGVQDEVMGSRLTARFHAPRGDDRERVTLLV